MATIAYTVVKHPWDDRVKVVKWPNMKNGDDGKPYWGSIFVDRSVQMKGTLGPGGEMTFQGSNDNEDAKTYHTLSDPQGNALLFSTLKLEAVSETALFNRPKITGGDGTTDLTVTMVAR